MTCPLSSHVVCAAYIHTRIARSCSHKAADKDRCRRVGSLVGHRAHASVDQLGHQYNSTAPTCHTDLKISAGSSSEQILASFASRIRFDGGEDDRLASSVKKRRLLLLYTGSIYTHQLRTVGGRGSLEGWDHYTTQGTYHEDSHGIHARGNVNTNTHHHDLTLPPCGMERSLHWVLRDVCSRRCCQHDTGCGLCLPW